MRTFALRGHVALVTGGSRGIGAAIVKALGEAKQRRRWTAKADSDLVKALEAGLKNPKSKGFVMKPNGEARHRYKWDGMTVQFNLYPKGPGKTSIVAPRLQRQ